jgi:hypothetical protein
VPTVTTVPNDNRANAGTDAPNSSIVDNDTRVERRAIALGHRDERTLGIDECNERVVELRGNGISMLHAPKLELPQQLRRQMCYGRPKRRY